ncbi:MAG: hypothetical protein JJT77_04985 [Crocinitomicaceae bacterium]|nr:hypothetical protein [Crocinitomicaceae bacterium]
MKTTSSHFGKISIPSTNQVIESCWLRLDGAKPYLEVPNGSFQSENWEIIHGSFNGLNKVTFYICNLGYGKGGRGGAYRRINFSFMFEHVAFQEKSQLVFSKVKFDSDALENWINDNTVSTNLIETPEGLQLTIPNRTVLHTVSTTIGDISIIKGFDKEIGLRDAKLLRKTRIEIQLTKPLHFDEINQILIQLKRLILFLAHESPQIGNYIFPLNERKSIVLKEHSRFNNLSGFSEGLELNYREIKPDIETIIKNWFEKEKLVQIIELIQEKYMNTNLSFQNYFFNCSVAVESFHKCIVKGKFSLRNRISHFAESIASIIGKHISISTDDFIDKIVKTRNNIAHEGKYLEDLTMLELLLFGKVLELVIKIEILKELGVTSPKILEAFYEDARNTVGSLAEMNGYNKVD